MKNKGFNNVPQNRFKGFVDVVTLTMELWNVCTQIVSQGSAALEVLKLVSFPFLSLERWRLTYFGEEFITLGLGNDAFHSRPNSTSQRARRDE